MSQQIELQIPQTGNSKPDEASSGFKSSVEKASFLSKSHFAYAWPILTRTWKRINAKQELTEDDMLTINRNNRGEILEKGFLEHLTSQKRRNPNKPASTAWAVAMTVKWKFLLLVLYHIIFGWSKISLSWVMKRLIENYMDPASTDSYWWAAILAANLIFGFYSEHHWVYQCFATGNYVRAGIVSMLYNKITKLSVHSIIKISPGKLMNIATNNVNFLEILNIFFPAIIAGWFILIAGTVLLWTFFGVTCLIGIGYLIIIVPFVAWTASRSIKFKHERNGVTDERLRKISETVMEYGF